jgi:hypothetical protein
VSVSTWDEEAQMRRLARVCLECQLPACNEGHAWCRYRPEAQAVEMERRAARAANPGVRLRRAGTGLRGPAGARG